MQEAIPVTQKHIDEATTEKSWCPIHRALKAQYEYVSIGYNNLWLSKGEEFYAVEANVTAWIKRFDRTGKADPFMLILDHSARTATMMEAA